MSRSASQNDTAAPLVPARQPMKAIVASVAAGSIAEAAGIRPGDVVLSVNGNAHLEDMFDWQFELAGCALLELHIRRTDAKGDNQDEVLELEKEADDDPGMVFTSPIFTPIRTCNNACPFCFIDQQPEGLRASLYVKDDDYRLSYFANTYITLTNLTPRDRERMARLRPGPLYVSVHATVPEVRQVLLKNPKAGNILEELRWLKSLEVPFHCQIVVCPGINDGGPLRQSLLDLASLRPECLSVAVVPVGLTQYRSDLPELTSVDVACAASVIEAVEAFRTSTPGGRDFVFLSDEFYFKAGRALPSYEEYSDFPQLDDGVGTARMLLADFFALEKDLPAALADTDANESSNPSASRNVLLLTGKLGAMILQPIAARLNEIQGLYVDVVPVKSRFWGDSVDVAGLVTGADIRVTLADMDTSGYHMAVIPSVMLKQSTDAFLDGQTVPELTAAFTLPFQVIQDSYSARELVDLIISTNSPAA